MEFHQLYEWNNSAIVALQENRLDAAENLFREYLKYDSDPQVEMNLGITLLKKGKFKEGIDFYESRLRFLPLEPVPFDLWDGRKCQKLLIQSDAGLGDCIQMMRYFSVICRMGIEITFLGPKEFHRLIQDNFPYVKCIDKVPMTGYNYYIPMFSLLKMFGPIERTPYIRVYPIEDNGKIGICWRGSMWNPKTQVRSMGLEQLIPLLETGKKFVCLQQFFTTWEEKVLNDHRVEILDLTNLEDTAKIIARLRGVITIDTSIAHLAGAIGKQTKIMLHSASDWRWHLEVPLYSSVAPIEQSKPNDWSNVVKSLINSSFE